jgi:hypothetical protein
MVERRYSPPVTGFRIFFCHAVSRRWTYSRPTARGAADASRSSLKLSPAPAAAGRETAVSAAPRLTEIIPVACSVCFLKNVLQNWSDHFCPKYPHQVRLLVLPSRGTGKYGGKPVPAH